MVSIAETAVSREIRILEAERTKCQRLLDSGEKLGLRTKDLIRANCVHADSIQNFDVVVTGLGTALVTKTMGSLVSITHNMNIGLDESIPRCDCKNFVLEGIPCQEACAFIMRMKMDPFDFARPYFRAETGLALATAGLSNTKVPVIVQSNLYVSDPPIVAPLLLPIAGRPKKKRITKKSAKKAMHRKLKYKARKSDIEIIATNKATSLPNKPNQDEAKIRSEYKCSRCRKTGHTIQRCRERTDGRGNIMTKKEQDEENRLFCFIEIGGLGKTELPKS